MYALEDPVGDRPLEDSESWRFSEDTSSIFENKYSCLRISIGTRFLYTLEILHHNSETAAINCQWGRVTQKRTQTLRRESRRVLSLAPKASLLSTVHHNDCVAGWTHETTAYCGPSGDSKFYEIPWKHNWNLPCTDASGWCNSRERGISSRTTDQWNLKEDARTARSRSPPVS